MSCGSPLVFCAVFSTYCSACFSLQCQHLAALDEVRFHNLSNMKHTLHSGVMATRVFVKWCEACVVEHVDKLPNRQCPRVIWVFWFENDLFGSSVVYITMPTALCPFPSTPHSSNHQHISCLSWLDPHYVICELLLKPSAFEETLWSINKAGAHVNQCLNTSVHKHHWLP